MWMITKINEWYLLENEFDWIKDMNGVLQDKIHHEEGDVAVHTKMVLSALEQLQEYRELPEQERHILYAAALLHDVEKRSTTVLEEDGSITSKGHAKRGALTARNILYKDIPTPFVIREQICALVRYHGLPLWAIEKPDPARAVIKASLQVDTKLLYILAKADVFGRICKEQDSLIYKTGLFQGLCEENDCWGKPRSFKTANAQFHYFHKENLYPDFVPYDELGSTVVLMSGLPGSGKDTYVRKFYKDWPVINLDVIRKSQKISAGDSRGNGKVIQLAKETARTYLRAQQKFVWNATNITRQMRDQLIDLFSTYKASITVVYVEVGYDKLFIQNSSREAIVPRIAIEKLAAKLEVPVRSEAHEVIYYVQG